MTSSAVRLTNRYSSGCHGDVSLMPTMTSPAFVPAPPGSELAKLERQPRSRGHTERTCVGAARLCGSSYRTSKVRVDAVDHQNDVDVPRTRRVRVRHREIAREHR